MFSLRAAEAEVCNTPEAAEAVELWMEPMQFPRAPATHFQSGLAELDALGLTTKVAGGSASMEATLRGLGSRFTEAVQVTEARAILAAVVGAVDTLTRIKVASVFLAKVTTLHSASQRTTHSAVGAVAAVERLDQTSTAELEKVVGGGSFLLEEAEVTPAVQVEQVVAETVVSTQILERREQTGAAAVAAVVISASASVETVLADSCSFTTRVPKEAPEEPFIHPVVTLSTTGRAQGLTQHDHSNSKSATSVGVFRLS